jgi:hypothetical protein
MYCSPLTAACSKEIWHQPCSCNWKRGEKDETTVWSWEQNVWVTVRDRSIGWRQQGPCRMGRRWWHADSYQRPAILLETNAQFDEQLEKTKRQRPTNLYYLKRTNMFRIPPQAFCSSHFVVSHTHGPGPVKPPLLQPRWVPNLAPKLSPSLPVMSDLTATLHHALVSPLLYLS